jgi:hypothetical protein
MAAANLKDNFFLEALKASPIGREVAQQEASKEIARRKALAADMARIRNVLEKEIPKHDARIAELMAAAKAAEAAVRKTYDSYNAALHAKSIFRLAHERDYALAELSLRNSGASSAIDEFLSLTIDDLDATRKKSTSIETVEENAATGKTTRRAASNAPSVAVRIRAIHAAREAAHDLRLAPDQHDVGARLAALRAGLPPVLAPVMPEEK